MSSPAVRRQRLGAELKTLRLRRGLTTEQLGALFYQSRMKISRLENGRIRPNLAEVMELLDLLSPPEEERDQLLRIAKEAASRGWWEVYGDAMSPGQRLCADLESGAVSIREYCLGTMPGLLRLPEIMRVLPEQDGAGTVGDPERRVQALIHRQEVTLRPSGPSYEVIFDEVGLRRFDLPPSLMARQLRHITGLAQALPQLTIRVFPFSTGRIQPLMPLPQITLFAFPDPGDPLIALSETTHADVTRIEGDAAAQHLLRYEAVREHTLPVEDSLALLDEIAEQVSS